MSRDLMRKGRAWRRGLAACVLAIALAAAAPAAAFTTQPPAAQDEFVPASEVDPQDELPSAPFVIAAYAVAWVVIGLYVFSLWRRLARVERDIQSLAGRVSKGR